MDFKLSPADHPSIQQYKSADKSMDHKQDCSGGNLASSKPTTDNYAFPT